MGEFPIDRDAHDLDRIRYISERRFLEEAGGGMPEWIGSALFLVAVGLTGSKLSDDFGKRGMRGYAMLMLMLGIYAGAIGIAYAAL